MSARKPRRISAWKLIKRLAATITDAPIIGSAGEALFAHHPDHDASYTLVQLVAEVSVGAGGW